MIAFEDRGSGPAITFLHGFALDRRMWSAQVQDCAATHRTLVVDLPGFGRPSAACVGADCPAQAVLDLLDARGVERTHLFGHSFGGAVAVDLALVHPDRVSSLTLVDALLLGHDPRIEAWESCATLAQDETRYGEARRAWLADPIFAPARRNPEVARLLDVMGGDYACGHWAGRVATRWLVRDPARRLVDLHVPTLVLDGELDTPSFRAMASEYVRLLPNARRVTIPDAGHVCNLEAPDAFNAIVRGFVGKFD